MFYRLLNNIKVSTRLAILGLILITTWIKTFYFCEIHEESLLLNLSLATFLSISAYYLISTLVNRVNVLSFQSFTHYFSWISLCFIPSELFSPVFLIGSNILLVLLNLIFNIHLQFNKKSLFNFGVIIGLLSLLDPLFSLLLVWIFFIQIIHRDSNIWKWIASLLGFGSILILFYAIIGFTDYHINYQQIFNPIMEYANYELWLLMFVFGSTIASINFFSFTVNLNLTEKEEFKTLYILAIFLSIIYLFNKSTALLFTIPFALKLSFWFINIQNKRSRNFLLILSLSLAIYLITTDLLRLPVF